VRAITIQPPWSWAVAYGGKTVENRSQCWGWRGPVLVHAGARWSQRGAADPRVVAAYRAATLRYSRPMPAHSTALEAPARVGPVLVHPSTMLPNWPELRIDIGKVVAVADLVDCHRAEPGCCPSAWAETTYPEHPAGPVRTEVHHLVLAHVTPLVDPVPARGRLGLWLPGAQLVDDVLWAMGLPLSCDAGGCNDAATTLTWDASWQPTCAAHGTGRWR
jgi:hypothetical protein